MKIEPSYCVISICKVKLDSGKNKIDISWILHKFPVSFSHSAQAQSVLNLINNLTSPCLYEDCLRSLTRGKIIKYVLHCLLFLTLFKMLKQCRVPVGVSEEGTQNTAASVHREPLPWHICTEEGDLSCFGGSKIWDLSICSPAWRCECWRQGTSPAFD